ncbi:MAG: hypothetical protein KDD50_01740 [Bdellovibrionales bacterium]|nr:hypothetical protein [Bdellovibrionales bacterium]
MNFKKINKLKKGDKIAILSPSFAAPGKWPHVYELCLSRLKNIFELEPVEYPSTKKLVLQRKKDRMTLSLLLKILRSML